MDEKNNHFMVKKKLNRLCRLKLNHEMVLYIFYFLFSPWLIYDIVLHKIIFNEKSIKLPKLIIQFLLKNNHKTCSKDKLQIYFCRPYWIFLLLWKRYFGLGLVKRLYFQYFFYSYFEHYLNFTQFFSLYFSKFYGVLFCVNTL